jgi:hypothetical protein
MKNYIFKLAILIIILAACSPQPTTTSAPTPIPTRISQTITVSANPTATTAIPTFTPQPQPTQAGKLAEECIRIEPQMPADLALTGVWVTNPGRPRLENLADHLTYRIPLKGDAALSSADGDLSISPDGTYLAYIDSFLEPIRKYRTEKRILRIIRSSGYMPDVNYWQEVETWQWIIGWLDNEHLAIAMSNQQVVILNPFTGEWQQFKQPKWVNYNTETSLYRWDGSSYRSDYPFYNPSLEWVLVPRGSGSLDLKSVQTGTTVWQVDHAGWSGWSVSSTSTTFAISMGETIVIYNPGKPVREYAVNGLGYNYISDLKLSPDGQKLVFNSAKSSHSYQPVILDLEQNKLSWFCNDEFSAMSSIPGFWSPDGRFIIKGGYDSNYGQFDLLIDTQQLRAYPLEADYYHRRIAWLALPSVAETKLP